MEGLGPSDAELISRTRAGDNDAWARLYERHHAAAERVALRIAGRDDGQDLVADAFLRIWSAIRVGKGPEYAFKAYLMTTIRNLYCNRLRDESRVIPTADERLQFFAPAVGDSGDQFAESTVLAQAFSSLPDRWKAVLWHSVVEEEPLEAVAARMGVTRGALAALAYRAREGLRHAYLAQHVAYATDRTCREVRTQVPAYHRGHGTEKIRRQVEAHLEWCGECRQITDELGAIMSPRLGGLLVPALLGLTLQGYRSTIAASGTDGPGEPDATRLVNLTQRPRLLRAQRLVRDAGAWTAVAGAVVAVAATQILGGARSPETRRADGHDVISAPPASLDATRWSTRNVTPTVESVRPQVADDKPVSAGKVDPPVISSAAEHHSDPTIVDAGPGSSAPPGSDGSADDLVPTDAPPPSDDELTTGGGDLAGKGGPVVDQPLMDPPVEEVLDDQVAIVGPTVRVGDSLSPGSYLVSVPVSSTAAVTTVRITAPGLVSVTRHSSDLHGSMSCGPVLSDPSPTVVCRLSEALDPGAPLQVDLVLSGPWAGGEVSAVPGATAPSPADIVQLPAPEGIPSEL